MLTLVQALTRSGPSRLNIPDRAYWTTPQHGQEAVRRVRGYMWWLACILAGAASLIHLLVVAAQSHTPPRLATGGVLAALGVILLSLGGWAGGWYRLLRRPADS